MLRIDSRKESKFTCKRSIIMEIPGLISLLKLLVSIQELILISVLIPFLESFLITLPEQIAIPRSIPILEPILIPDPIPTISHLGIDFSIGVDSSIGFRATTTTANTLVSTSRQGYKVDMNRTSSILWT